MQKLKNLGWGQPDQCKVKKKKVVSYFQRQTLYIWLANTGKKKEKPTHMLHSAKVWYWSTAQSWIAYIA